jgi:predicted phosphodiesterase
VLIGILADSHGLAERIRQGIAALERRGAECLIHLGDVTDTLRLDSVDECVGILIENDIRGVMGNHEYSLVTHHFKRYPDRFADSTRRYVCSLPMRFELADVCFTHFSPEGGVHGLYAPTDDAGYETALRSSTWPILINGHSHDPRICRRLNGRIENVSLDMTAPYRLTSGARYILTCGALEDGYCALFDTENRWFEVIALPS